MSDASPPLPLSAECPTPVDRPRFLNRWSRLTFLHWPVDPDEVALRLPPGLRPDVHDGSGWVSLVPFEMRDCGPRA